MSDLYVVRMIKYIQYIYKLYCCTDTDINTAVNFESSRSSQKAEFNLESSTYNSVYALQVGLCYNFFGGQILSQLWDITLIRCHSEHPIFLEC